MIVVLLTQVLPVFDEVYAGLGGSLTGVAGGLLSLGRALDAAMPFLCVLLGLGIAALCLFAASYSFREWVLSLWRKLRGDKGMSRKLNTARFAQAFSMGLKSGLPLEDALDLSASLLESAPAAKARCLDCQTRLEKGAPLVKAMGESGVLPRSDCRLLELGMKSGAGDSTMGQISSRLSEESEAALEEKIGQVEPTLVVTASILIGLILLSVMLPLMHIMTAIG